MRLREIVDMLKSVELKQIIVGEQDDQIIALLNMAIIDVYSRLNILQEEQIIMLKKNRTRYNLIETSQKILSVYRGEVGKEGGELDQIAINDNNDPDSVFTPAPYILYVPIFTQKTYLSVVQVVIPPFITSKNIDTLDLIVPPQLMECITNYVGYRAYISMNGHEQQSDAQSYYNRYLRAINDVLQRGAVHPTILTNKKLTERGFR